jgi:hypothetical protein
LELSERLNTLSGDSQVQRPAKGKYTSDDGITSVEGHHSRNEGTVYFDGVEWVAVNISKGTVASTEVIKRHANP